MSGTDAGTGDATGGVGAADGTDEGASAGTTGESPPPAADLAPAVGADEFDARPGREATLVVVVPALLAGVALLGSAPAAGLFGVLGLPLLVGGVLRGRRSLVAGGAVALLGGVAMGGLLGAPPESLLLAAAGALVAWDAAEHAVGLGEAVGRRAAIRRSLAVHVAGSGLLTALGAAVAYGAFRTAGGGSPLALALLLAGAVALVSVLRA